MTNSAYKSIAAKEKVLAGYDKLLARWPVPCESRFIQTSFGETHLIISGSQTAKPLVLLHGGGGNATMWIYNIAELAKHYRIYAIDIIGEPGKSAEIRPRYDSNDYAIWLNEVFTNLNLDKAPLCGASLGGFLAHQFALKFPEKISQLILLAPPSLFKMRLAFLLRAIFATLIPKPAVIISFLNYISTRAKTLPQQVIEDFVITWQGYKPNSDKIPVISAAELAQLPTNTLLLLGDSEVIYDAKKVAGYVHTVALNIKILMVPNAGHTISVDQPSFVNFELLKAISS